MITLMSRPPVEDRDLIRSKQLKLMVRHAQHARWAARAKVEGESLPQWMRRVLDRAARTG